MITTPASLSTESIGRWLGHQPEFLHVSWTVDSLEKAAAFFAHTLGAGPFFSIENVVFDRLAWDRPSSPVWNHSTALGAWGDLVIEIQQMHEIRPAELAEKLSSAPNTLNHIGYVAGDYRAESDRLIKLGMPRRRIVGNSWHAGVLDRIRASKGTRHGADGAPPWRRRHLRGRGASTAAGA